MLFTKNLAIDYGGKEIRANCIWPGLHRHAHASNAFDLPGMEDVRAHGRGTRCANLGRLARSRRWRHSCCRPTPSFTGQAIVADGGWHLAGRDHGVTCLMGLS